MVSGDGVPFDLLMEAMMDPELASLSAEELVRSIQPIPPFDDWDNVTVLEAPVGATSFAVRYRYDIRHGVRVIGDDGEPIEGPTLERFAEQMLTGQEA